MHWYEDAQSSNWHNLWSTKPGTAHYSLIIICQVIRNTSCFGECLDSNRLQGWVSHSIIIIITNNYGIIRHGEWVAFGFAHHKFSKIALSTPVCLTPILLLILNQPFSTGVPLKVLPWEFGTQWLKIAEKRFQVWQICFLGQLSVLTNCCASYGRGTDNLIQWTVVLETELQNPKETIESVWHIKKNIENHCSSVLLFLTMTCVNLRICLLALSCVCPPAKINLGFNFWILLLTPWAGARSTPELQPQPWEGWSLVSFDNSDPYWPI